MTGWVSSSDIAGFGVRLQYRQKKSYREVDANRCDECDANRDGGLSDNVAPVHKSSRMPLKWMPHLAFSFEIRSLDFDLPVNATASDQLPDKPSDSRRFRRLFMKR